MKPIVFKLMKQIRVRTWNPEDYLQEGRLVLHQILTSSSNVERIHTKFKVQYHQRLIDEIRHIQAQKRGFDRLGGIDVYEHSDWLPSHEVTPENELIFNHLLEEIYEQLSAHYQELLVRQMQGEELTRMERYRLKEKIKAILFDVD